MRYIFLGEMKKHKLLTLGSEPVLVDCILAVFLFLNISADIVFRIIQGILLFRILNSRFFSKSFPSIVPVWHVSDGLLPFSGLCFSFQ